MWHWAHARRVKDLGMALEIATSILPAYEALLGTPYPLPKLDLVAIPDFAAGMPLPLSASIAPSSFFYHALAPSVFNWQDQGAAGPA